MKSRPSTSQFANSLLKQRIDNILFNWIGFPTPWVGYCWLGMFISFVPLSLWLRFRFLSNALIEPHPIRQSQTALTIYYMAKEKVSFLNYASPLDGKLWNFVLEVPIYQWLASRLVQLGVPLEIAARTITLAMFFAGAFVLFWLVSKLFSKHIAAFLALVYLILPFNIVFSRSCLIDFTAVTFFIFSLLGMFLAVQKREKNYHFFLGVSFLFGTMAATMKVTIWYSPTLFLFCWISFLTWNKTFPRRFGLIALSSLIFQLVLTVLWLRWGSHIRGYFTSPEWILGTVSQRFDVFEWAKWFRVLVRNVLNDWLFPFFLVGIFAPGQYRKWSWTLAGVIAFSSLVTFNIHIYHDYYFIGEIPYIILLVAIGVHKTLRLKPRTRATILMITAVLLTYRLVKVKYVFSPLFYDYHQDLAKPHAIKSLSDPDELVYVTGHMENWDIPLYSERLVILPIYYDPKTLTPSLFQFDDTHVVHRELDRYPTVWVDGDDINFPVFRVGTTAKFRFRADAHIGVSTKEISKALPDLNWGMELNACGKSEAFRTGVPSGGHLKVTAMPSGLSFVLPSHPVLYLPKESKWGCRFLVTHVPRS